MKKNCPVCFGIGWVCLNHPDKAFDDELGCACSPGMPCDSANSGGRATYQYRVSSSTMMTSLVSGGSLSLQG